jgi:hypothetical protein
MQMPLPGQGHFCLFRGQCDKQRDEAIQRPEEGPDLTSFLAMTIF